MRQALTESMLLSLFGGAAGLAIAFAGTRLILHFAFPPNGGMAGIPIDASPSLPVLLFAFGVSVIAGVAFGIAPAWMATRVDPIEALRGASRVTARTGSVPRKTLVVFQTALSLVLLSASGLLTSALHALENQDFGFEQDRRMVAKINPQACRLPASATLATVSAHPRFDSRHSRRVFRGSVPILAAWRRDWGSGVWVDGHPAPGPGRTTSVLGIESQPGYFDVIGTPIVRGRGISEAGYGGLAARGGHQ